MMALLKALAFYIVLVAVAFLPDLPGRNYFRDNCDSIYRRLQARMGERQALLIIFGGAAVLTVIVMVVMASPGTHTPQRPE
jgi:hypothetical protein